MAAASSAWLRLRLGQWRPRQIRRSARRCHLDGHATQDQHERLVAKVWPAGDKVDASCELTDEPAVDDA